MKTTYRKNSIEAKLDSLLPEYPSFDVIAHELQHDGESYSTNDSWFLARGCDREEAIGHLVNRWHVFKANYAPRARVRDLSDANWSGDEFPSLLEVDCIPFAEVRNGGADEETETGEKEESTQDASLNPEGIVQSFLESDQASDIEEDDLETVQAHFEHGQWWIQVLATGQSFSVVDVQATNGTRSIAFEQL